MAEAVTYNESRDLQKGEQTMLFYGDKPIAYIKSQDFSTSVATDDVSSKMSGEYDSSLPGRISWSFDVSSMVSVTKGHLSFQTLLACSLERKPLKIVERKVTMKVDPASGEKTFEGGDIIMQGECIIENIKKSSSAGDRDTFSCTLKGCGPLYGAEWGKPIKAPDATTGI